MFRLYAYMKHKPLPKVYTGGSLVFKLYRMRNNRL